MTAMKASSIEKLLRASSDAEVTLDLPVRDAVFARHQGSREAIRLEDEA